MTRTAQIAQLTAERDALVDRYDAAYDRWLQYSGPKPNLEHLHDALDALDGRLEALQCPACGGCGEVALAGTDDAMPCPECQA